MKKAINILAAAATLAMVASAMADGSPQGYHARPVARPVHVTQHPLAGLREINMRQHEQRTRIEAGLHRGAITRFEFRRLMREQREIEAMEHAFVSDGFLSPHERVELRRRLNAASHHIVAEVQDHQRRY